MKELTVLRPFAYGGKMRSKGERITTANRHAAILVAAGKVRMTEPRSAQKEDKSAVYETSRMTAESAGAGRRRTLRLKRSRGEPSSQGYARSDMAAEREPSRGQ